MHFCTLLGLGLARATVKLSAAFFHDESSITIGAAGGCRKKKFSDCKQDVDLSYKTFLDKITKLLDIHAVKKLSHKEKKSPSKPWLTYFHP